MDDRLLLAQITAAMQQHADALEKMAQAKRVWVDAESLVIEYKIKLERLQEQLKSFRETDINVAPDDRELEIEAYRIKMPELLKKV